MFINRAIASSDLPHSLAPTFAYVSIILCGVILGLAHCIIILLPYVAHKFDLESTHVLNVPNIQKGVYSSYYNTCMHSEIKFKKGAIYGSSTQTVKSMLLEI